MSALDRHEDTGKVLLQQKVHRTIRTTNTRREYLLSYCSRHQMVMGPVVLDRKFRRTFTWSEQRLPTSRSCWQMSHKILERILFHILHQGDCHSQDTYRLAVSIKLSNTSNSIAHDIMFRHDSLPNARLPVSAPRHGAPRTLVELVCCHRREEIVDLSFTICCGAWLLVASNLA